MASKKQLAALKKARRALKASRAVEPKRKKRRVGMKSRKPVWRGIKGVMFWAPRRIARLLERWF
jgi:hypothetical protein